jgi:hypothetical protein
LVSLGPKEKTLSQWFSKTQTGGCDPFKGCMIIFKGRQSKNEIALYPPEFLHLLRQNKFLGSQNFERVALQKKFENSALSSFHNFSSNKVMTI